jgi:predicted site-specific integrase-resolvase
VNPNRMTPRDLSNRWLLNITTLERWRSEGKEPPYLKIQGRVLYRLEDIEAYEARHLHRSPGERVQDGSVA